MLDMTGLTTHVLDLAHGWPGANIKVELYKIGEKTKTYVNSMITNQDGRLEEPILSEHDISKGVYEMLFHILL